MAIANAFIYEFVYRGADPTDPASAFAYHVVLGQVGTDAFSGAQKLNLSTTLSVEQATAAGYDLASVLKEINAEALQQTTDQTSQIAALTAQAEVATDDAAAAKSQIAMQAAQLAQAQSDLAAAEAQIVDLTAQLAAAQAPTQSAAE